MAKEVKAKCDNDQYRGIHEALDKVRSNSKTVKVDREALNALLEDHAALWAFHDATVNPSVQRYKGNENASDLV